MIILCKLIQHAYAIDNCIVVSFLDYSGNSFCIESIAGKALDKLAKSVGANYGDATAEIQGRIDNIDSDDDGLANVMKAAIKAALYSKIANGDSIGVVFTRGGANPHFAFGDFWLYLYLHA